MQFPSDDDFEAMNPDKPSHSHADMRGRLQSPADAVRYITAGKATITLLSQKTNVHFTYRIAANDDGTCHFVNLLNGPDNESDFKYIGRLVGGVVGIRFYAGRKNPRPGDISRTAPSVVAFDWTWRQLCLGKLPDQLAIYHEGVCGRCGHKLTRPESVAQGFGPECINKI